MGSGGELWREAMKFGGGLAGQISPQAMSWAGTVGAGAAIGGGVSWMTGGYFTSGAITGAGMAGGMRAGIGAMRSSGFTIGATNVASMFASKEARRGAVLGGAALGGMIFGGNRSYARGFNAQRGNRFGR